MSELSNIIIAAFAVFRVSELVVEDNGPWHIFRRLRECSTHPMWCELMSCYYCQSMWWAFAAMLALRPEGLVDAWLWWLGIAGGAAFIRRVAGGRQ